MVIQNEEISGSLTIKAANVTLKCLKINPGGTTWGVNCFASGANCNGLIVEDVEIHNCASACATSRASSTNPSFWRRVHLHDSEFDLMKLEGNTTLEYSYLHGFTPAAGAHNDAIQTSGPAENIVVRGSWIEGPYQDQTSAYIVKVDFGNINKLLIEDSYLSGGNFTLYLRDGNFGSLPPTNVVVRNNVWNLNSWQFGSLSSDMIESHCLEWYGNTFSDGNPYNVASASPPGLCGVTTPNEAIPLLPPTDLVILWP